jgi:hypothetical protein
MQCACAILSSLACPAVNYFSTLSHKWQDFHHHHHHHHHHHKHQGLGPLIRSVPRVTTAAANVSSVFQLFSFLVVCSGMILKGFGFVAFFARFSGEKVIEYKSVF